MANIMISNYESNYEVDLYDIKKFELHVPVTLCIIYTVQVYIGIYIDPL